MDPTAGEFPARLIAYVDWWPHAAERERARYLLSFGRFGSAPTPTWAIATFPRSGGEPVEEFWRSRPGGVSREDLTAWLAERIEPEAAETLARRFADRRPNDVAPPVE